MTDLMNKSLAQIVTTNHKAAAIFEKYHLDFCCKGKRSLQQACVENELPVAEVIDALTKTNDQYPAISSNYDRYSLTELVNHIEATHHQYVKKEMPAIIQYLQKVAAKHGDRHPEMIKVLEIFTAVKEEMDQHMQKEEVILFKRIKEIEEQVAEGQLIHLDSTYLLAPIQVMEQEHDETGAMLDEIRKLTNDYTPPTDACTTYHLCFSLLQAFEIDLHMHVHLENHILFPKAIKLFSQAKQLA